MADREKVTKGIWQCWCPSDSEEYETQCIDCPYFNPDGLVKDCMTELRRDAISLLKEQEAVEPKVIRTNAFGHPVHACGKCGLLITESMNYCHECGKRIDWEGR